MADAGIPIRTTMDNSTTVQYAGLLQRMVDQSRNSVRDMDPQDDLTFLRIRSKKHEIMIAPGKLSSQILVSGILRSTSSVHPP